MSFGLSRGKELITKGYGFDSSELPSYEVSDPEASRVDPRTWFEDAGKHFEIEIGSGKGTFLIQQAGRSDDVNFLGIEQAGEFYRYAADRMRRRAIHNVRMLRADATEFIEYRCPSGIVRVIHLYFSDPWPKKRHHKRRVIQDESLKQFHRVLLPEGELRLVTDHDDLWEWYELYAARHGDLFERRTFVPPDSAGDGEIVGTNYERKFTLEGRFFHSMVLKKLAPGNTPGG